MRIFKNYGIWLMSSALLITVFTSLLPKSRGGAAARPAAAPTQPAPAPTAPVTRQPQRAPTATAQQPQPATRQIQPAAPATSQMQFSNVSLIKKRERFTQTEAYLQNPKLRQNILDTFKDKYAAYEPVRHMDIVSRAMAKEAEFRDTHWCFYHGISNEWNVWQDVYAALYDHFNPSEMGEDNKFVFLRKRGKSQKSVKNFLVDTLEEHGLVDDNNELAGMLLSTNLTLFGNTGRQGRGECTWFYLFKDQDHALPSRERYQEAMDDFGLPYTYIDQLMQLADLFTDEKQQTLLQIFVPKNIVDDIGYVAWATGIPANKRIIKSVEKKIEQKEFVFKEKKPARLWALEDLKTKFKTAQTKNPMFAEMVKEIEQGVYSLDAYLTRLCNTPSEVSDINTVQGRFLFSDELLLNPKSGIKMFRHDNIDSKKVQDYRRQLNALIKQIVGKQ